jgi:MurNAc alpha-1-phosphate uridylyltransferase
MLLAAGRGERMRPLTDHTPKPLLEVRGKPLMQWPLEALSHGGFQDVVVNTAWLGEQIEARFGTHPVWEGAHATRIVYSHEGRDFGGALETAGGIVRALPLLGDVFWVVAGDIFAPGFNFDAAAADRFERSGLLAHLWLVPNPLHNPRGDFGLGQDGMATNAVASGIEDRYTFSTVGLYRRALFGVPWCDISAGNPEGLKAPLAPLLRRAIEKAQVSAELYLGPWTDVGTPQRLEGLQAPSSGLAEASAAS